MRRIVALLAIAVSLVACSTAPSSNASPSPKASTIELTVYGAASLKGVLEATKATYEAAVPGRKLTIATDASSTLRTQIEQGATADVFLSADETNPTKLVEGGLADGSAVDFAGNTLVVIVPTANPASIATPSGLAKVGTKIIAAGAEVPITKYATEAVANLANEPGYPAGFAASYASNIVSKEDNVKAVVAKIELGEGDAAIVYVTDAKASRVVKTIEIPAAANVPATYAGVVIKASTHRDESHAFLTWLAGPDGQAVLSRFGFLPPS